MQLGEKVRSAENQDLPPPPWPAMFRKLKEPPLSKPDVFADSVEDARLTSPISGRFDLYRSHKALLSVGIDHAKLKKRFLNRVWGPSCPKLLKHVVKQMSGIHVHV